jgi:hypothetical protein
MAYGDFTIEDIKARLGLTLREGLDLYGSVAPRAVSPRLAEWLAEHAPLASDISTEKARSELVIAPILMEVRRQLKPAVSVFSGSDFNVEPELGLVGRCDFLLSRSPEQLAIEAPAVVVVEAKTLDLRPGFPQCAAAMAAARMFNQRRGTPTPAVCGAVTSGSVWRFLRLRESVLEIDRQEYFLSELGRVIGILCRMVEDAAPAPLLGSAAGATAGATAGAAA